MLMQYTSFNLSFEIILYVHNARFMSTTTLSRAGAGCFAGPLCRRKFYVATPVPCGKERRRLQGHRMTRSYAHPAATSDPSRL
jgi:hypothetical protein